MGKALNHARAVQKIVRVENKPVTAIQTVATLYKNKRAVDRDAYFTKRRALVTLLEAQLSFEERGAFATKGKDATARGAYERPKPRALPMQSRLWI